MLSVGQLAAPPTARTTTAGSKQFQRLQAPSLLPALLCLLPAARCPSWQGDVPVDVSELAYLEKL